MSGGSGSTPMDVARHLADNPPSTLAGVDLSDWSVADNFAYPGLEVINPWARV